MQTATFIPKKELRKKTEPQVAPQQDKGAEASEETFAETGVPFFLQRFTASAPPPPPVQREFDEEEDGKNTPVLQKFTVGAPDDRYEKEADQVADAVMRMSEARDVGIVDEEAQQAGQKNIIRTKPLGSLSAGSSCINCEEESDVKTDHLLKIQAKSDRTSSSSRKVLRALRLPGGGSPLPENVRSKIEPVLETDLGHVQIYTGPDTEQAARSIQAKAFTHENRIFLGKGQSPNDVRLMSHEATHVVQQGAAGQLVQRTPDDEVLDSEHGGEANVSTGLSARSRHETEINTIFSRLPERTEQEQADLNTILEARELYQLIEQKEAMERRFVHEERRGMGIIRYTSQNTRVMQRIQDEIDSECQRLGLANEFVARNLIRRRMPAMVLHRAKQSAIALLDRNEAMARAEMERYAELVCSPDIDGLLDADRELGARHAAMQITEYEINRASMYMSAIPAGIPTTAEEYGIPPNEASLMVVISNIGEYRERLENQRREYEDMRGRFGQVYPVLLVKGYEPGRFSSAPQEHLAQLTAQPLREIISNIHKVKEAVRDDEMKVWNMHQVIEIAISDMGIAGIPEYMEIVSRHIQRKHSEAGFLEMVKAALAITTTIIAGLVGGPLGAGLVGGAWGTYFLSESVGRYFMESAAENVAMDPVVRDISINEPELIWVVVDIVGLGLDVGALVRTIRPLARAALQTRRIAEFSQAVRRIIPEGAERLIGSLRRRMGREVIEEGAAVTAAVRALGEGRNLDEYLQALRSERHEAGTVGRSWDYQNQPRGLSDSAWRPGDPIDMPNTVGTYPPYDKARSRYWRNRAHFELEARARGNAVRRPGVTTDPVSGLTDDELRQMTSSGRAPHYAYGTRPGQTWELEHHGVPQRVGGWLKQLGFNQPGESSRLIEASRPGSLMEVTPLEHAFFDVEAHGFGRLRADIHGAQWAGTAAADIRGARPLYYMSDETIREIATRASREGMDFSRTAGTRQLRDALAEEIRLRGLTLSLP